VIKKVPQDKSGFILAKSFITYEIPRHPIKKRYVQRQEFERVITNSPIMDSPPSAILNAMSLLSLYYMQERAREEMGKGDINSATRHMKNLATHLLNKGENNLAQSILDEVAYIQQNQSFSEDGEKRIKYGTRSLLLPARTDENKL
jgi:Ca-activated chloride channel family protein